MTLLHSLLDDPLIRVRQRGDGAQRQLTLPGLFVALAADEIRDFPALRPHQRHPWHAFLVQLAAIALHHQGKDQPLGSEAHWRTALLDLTPEQPNGAAWCLVSPIDQPAFLQPPVPEGSLEKWDEEISPEAVDLLFLSKNHELKPQRMVTAAPDDWIFALVSLQTAAPFGGKENYGVARMNGGYSSRPGLGVLPRGGLGVRWQRDVEIMLANRDNLVAEHAYASSDGLSLCWLQPWDGSPNSALSFGEMDPFFIEVCRRVRMTQQQGRVSLRRTSTKSTRITKQEKDARKGNTGDLWTPIQKKEGKSIHVPETGFDYRLLTDLAFGSSWRAPSAQRLRAQDDHDGLRLVARGVSGANCRTHGYHERQVPLRSNMRRLFLQGNMGLLERIAARRVEAVSNINKELLSAIIELLDQGKNRNWRDIPDPIKKRAGALSKPFEQAEDLRFFDCLSKEVEATEAEREAIYLEWLLTMAERARDVLRQTFHAGPKSAERRYRAQAAATSRLEGGLRSTKVVPALAEHYRQERLSKENIDDSNRDRAEP